MDPCFSVSDVDNFEGGGPGFGVGGIDEIGVASQDQLHLGHHGAPLTPSGSSPSISSSSQLTPNPHMKEDEEGDGSNSSSRSQQRHDEKVAPPQGNSTAAGLKRDQMGFRNLPGLPNPPVTSAKIHRHHHRHHRQPRESVVDEREDEDEQNSLVTSSSSAFSVTSPRDATWSDREVEMDDEEDSDNSDESEDTEESEDQLNHFKPNSTVNGSQRSANSSPGHSNQGEHLMNYRDLLRIVT